MDSKPITAIAAWGGPERDVLTLLTNLPAFYSADPSDVDPGFVLYRQTEAEDEDDEERFGDVVGLEILDFLDFNHWELVPALAQEWQLSGWPPLPLSELLKRLQAKLRADARIPVRA